MLAKTSTAILLGVLLASAAFAQDVLPSMFEGQRAMNLGPLASRHAGAFAGPGEDLAGVPEHAARPEKSPRRAFLLSAVLPGAGQFYADSRTKAVVFFGIEALAAGLYFSWNSKGNDIEDRFRAMADAHWDPEVYMAWRTTTQAIRYNSFTHSLPCSLEIAQGRFGACGGREKQQYYELLGKYEQFVVGWDDLVFTESGNRVESPIAQVDSVEKVLSSLRLDYEDKRGDSNTYLKRAINVSGVILVNHVISAIDAARTARARAGGADAAALERRTRLLFPLQPDGRRQTPMLMAYKLFD